MTQRQVDLQRQEEQQKLKRQQDLDEFGWNFGGQIIFLAKQGYFHRNSTLEDFRNICQNHKDFGKCVTAGIAEYLFEDVRRFCRNDVGFGKYGLVYSDPDINTRYVGLAFNPNFTRVLLADSLFLTLPELIIEHEKPITFAERHGNEIPQFLEKFSCRCYIDYVVPDKRKVKRKDKRKDKERYRAYLFFSVDWNPGEVSDLD